MHRRDPNNYYVLLGLDPYSRDTYSNDDINQAYKKAALQYHPDKNKDQPEAAAEKFRKIKDAYAVLINVLFRMYYDDDLAIEDPEAFAEQRERTLTDVAVREERWRTIDVERKVQLTEKELKEKHEFEEERSRDKKIEADRKHRQQHKHQQFLERLGLQGKAFHAALPPVFDDKKIKRQRKLDSTHIIIKLLVTISISLTLLPRMLLEAFFGIFVIPVFVIFAPEHALSFIISGVNPNRPFHPIVRGLIILLTLCLLPVVMVIGAFVLPYVYFNRHERANAVKSYQKSILFFEPYFNSKIAETILVAACFASVAALVVLYPPAGLLHIFGTGGTIAAYLGLEAASKTMLVSVISSLMAGIAAMGNLIIDKIQSCFPKKYPEYDPPGVLSLEPKVSLIEAKTMQDTRVLAPNIQEIRQPIIPSSLENNIIFQRISNGFPTIKINRKRDDFVQRWSEKGCSEIALIADESILDLYLEGTIKHPLEWIQLQSLLENLTCYTKAQLFLKNQLSEYLNDKINTSTAVNICRSAVSSCRPKTDKNVCRKREVEYLVSCLYLASKTGQDKGILYGLSNDEHSIGVTYILAQISEPYFQSQLKMKLNHFVNYINQQEVKSEVPSYLRFFPVSELQGDDKTHQDKYAKALVPYCSQKRF